MCTFLKGVLGIYVSVGVELSLGGGGKFSLVVFDRGSGRIKYLGMLMGRCLGIFDVLLYSIVLGGWGLSSEQYPTLTGRVLGILVCLGILENMRLGILSGIMWRILPPDFGFEYYSLW